MDARDAAFELEEADLSVASLLAGWALADEVQRRLAADGLDDLRFTDGVVFQHLLGGALTVGTLAARLGVSQQAASKSIADLEQRGYVARAADPADARVRLVTLTPRGVVAVSAARRHRAELDAELDAALGPQRVEAARRLLVDALTHLGADTAIRRRRVRPPR
jgi:DNA-binding MarR family transcriptional regulator